jgi:hypothetical protein
MRLASTTWPLLLAVQAALLSGCTTNALWESGRLARFHEPNEPPNLRLFYSEGRQDVLAQYVEVRDSDEALRERAYWLHESAWRIQQRRKPQFVPVIQAAKLQVIPLVTSPGLNPPPSNARQYAVVSTKGGSFTLYSTNQSIGAFDLPVYEDPSGKVKKVLLTPLAVVADLSIVGGIIFYLTLPASWESLNYVAGSGH